MWRSFATWKEMETNLPCPEARQHQFVCAFNWRAILILKKKKKSSESFKEQSQTEPGGKNGDPVQFERSKIWEKWEWKESKQNYRWSWARFRYCFTIAIFLVVKISLIKSHTFEFTFNCFIFFKRILREFFVFKPFDSELRAFLKLRSWECESNLVVLIYVHTLKNCIIIQSKQIYFPGIALQFLYKVFQSQTINSLI